MHKYHPQEVHRFLNARLVEELNNCELVQLTRFRDYFATQKAIQVLKRRMKEKN